MHSGSKMKIDLFQLLIVISSITTSQNRSTGGSKKKKEIVQQIYASQKLARLYDAKEKPAYSV